MGCHFKKKWWPQIENGWIFFAPKKLEKMKEEAEDEVFTLSYYTSGSDGYFMLLDVAWQRDFLPSIFFIS